MSSGRSPEAEPPREVSIPGGEPGWGQGSLKKGEKLEGVRYELLSGSRAAARCRQRRAHNGKQQAVELADTPSVPLPNIPQRYGTTCLSKSQAPSAAP